MHGIGFEFSLQEWFDVKIPRTKIPKNYIENVLEMEEIGTKTNAKVLWLGGKPTIQLENKIKKGKVTEMSILFFYNKKDDFSVQLNRQQGEWLTNILPLLSPNNTTLFTLEALKAHYEAAGLSEFTLFWEGKMMRILRENGLLLL